MSSFTIKVRENGSLFITPEGWEGTWEVHETLRKSWVVIPFAALANPVRQGE